MSTCVCKSQTVEEPVFALSRFRVFLHFYEIPNEPIVYLVIAIHLKLDGYAPKYTLDSLKNLNAGAEEKGNKKTTDSLFENQLLNGGGEGEI